MVKNDIYLQGASKQNALFWKKKAPKKAPMCLMSRIDPETRSLAMMVLGNMEKDKLGSEHQIKNINQTNKVTLKITFDLIT